jgi:hypothetical protein
LAVTQTTPAQSNNTELADMSVDDIKNAIVANANSYSLANNTNTLPALPGLTYNSPSSIPELFGQNWVADTGHREGGRSFLPTELPLGRMFADAQYAGGELSHPSAGYSTWRPTAGWGNEAESMYEYDPINALTGILGTK